MTTKPFAPKDAENLKSEIISEIGLEYEGNEEMVDKLVARGLKDEEFKASLHQDKIDAREKLKETRKLAGLDPETGEKLGAKAPELPKGGDTTPKNDNLSLKDIRALQDVHDDDVEEVTEFAKFKGISVAEAKKHSVIQTLLRNREEERQTALATNTAKVNRGTSKVSDESLLEDFERGIISEEPEDIQRLAEAQLRKRKAEAKAAEGN